MLQNGLANKPTTLNKNFDSMQKLLSFVFAFIILSFEDEVMGIAHLEIK